MLTNYPSGLTLSNCVAIATQRNLKELSSQLAEKMAAIDRNASFSAFLPQVQLNYQSLSLSKQPATFFNDSAVVLQLQQHGESLGRLAGKVQPHLDVDKFGFAGWL